MANQIDDNKSVNLLIMNRAFKLSFPGVAAQFPSISVPLQTMRRTGRGYVRMDGVYHGPYSAKTAVYVDVMRGKYQVVGNPTGRK